MTFEVVRGAGGTRGRALIVVAAVAVACLAFSVLAPGSGAKQGIGNHTFVGTWSFAADGVIEQDGRPGRGVWEIARFTVDGKGNMTGGVEYSDLLGSDEALVEQPFRFEGKYTVQPDGTGTAKVDVTLPNGVVLQKSVWFVLNDIRDGEARGFYGGHLHAELGEGVHGHAGVHEGRRIQ